MSEATKAVQTAQKQEVSPSERFAEIVIAESGSGFGDTGLPLAKKRLAQNYFVKLDSQLKEYEQKRLQKSEQYREALAYTWQNVNITKLAQMVVASVKIGLDPLQPNHINMIPYANKATNKYDIGFLPGYQGMQIKATKYGMNPPDAVIVELIYDTDIFKPMKKSASNPIETYEFEIKNPFNRGEIVGGFYYHIYENQSKNKLVMMSIEDIEKRKPKNASVEFWGGEKDEWVNGKKTGKKIETDGWYAEMCLKTITRAAWNSIPIDADKVDESLTALDSNSFEFKQQEVREEVEANSAKTDLKLETTAEVVQPEAKAEAESDEDLFPTE